MGRAKEIVMRVIPAKVATPFMKSHQYFIGEYHGVSGNAPVNKSNEIVELDDGMVVLVIGPTDLYGRGGPDRNTNSIEAVVFKEWKYGYGGVSVFFNKDDLSIVY